MIFEIGSGVTESAVVFMLATGGETPEWCPRNKIQKENKENGNV